MYYDLIAIFNRDRIVSWAFVGIEAKVCIYIEQSN